MVTDKPAVIINDTASAAYLPGMSAAVSFKDAPKPTTPIEKQTGSQEIANWGESNDFPQQVLKDIAKNTIVGPALDFKARALYSGGLMYGSVKLIQQGEKIIEVFTPALNPEVETFKRLNNLNRYALEACTDLVTFYNGFPELILSKDRNKITGITKQDAAYCRWGKQNPKTGSVELCYINANWDNGGKPDDEFTAKVAVLDPYFDRVTYLKEGKAPKYIYPISYPTSGKTYYQLAHWNALRLSGWLDVANSVPAFKKALFENQMTIKYHIEISSDWWEWKYPDWQTYPLEKRAELKQTELKEFTDFMSGIKGTGKAFISTYKADPISQKKYSGWTISPIESKIPDGLYNADSQEASSHILFSLGVNPSLIGSSPGAKMNNGGGSEQRVAYNIFVTQHKAFQDLVTEPLDFISQYNGWNDEEGNPYVWRFRNSMITTLDEGTETKPNPEPKADA